jgi:hypothetical protein
MSSALFHDRLRFNRGGTGFSVSPIVLLLCPKLIWSDFSGRGVTIRLFEFFVWASAAFSAAGSAVRLNADLPAEFKHWAT